MSSDEHSDSSSEGEDIDTSGLVATRGKRATAGNLYATLRNNLDDEELQKELLAEDAEDEGDYEGSDAGDDDAAMDSSSDDEDAGPPKEGAPEDLEGEKELKKAERAQNRKKRKMEEVKMRLPVWQKKKKVKLADDVKGEDGSTVERPKKKSERSNWLPTEADMPVRQSARASAIANRESIHSNLKESAARSEKQKKIMAKHAERTQFNKRADLTQEERFAKAARIEKETAKEFGRWEREEAERQRIREEQLAAKRRRGIEGPIIRHWSGSVLWEGDRIKTKRMHGSKNLDEIDDDAESKGVTESETGHDKTTATSVTSTSTPGTNTPISNAPPIQSSTLHAHPSAPSSNVTPASAPAPAPAPAPAAQPAWLDGIQEYASRPADRASMPLQPSPYTPSAPALNGAAPYPTANASTAAQPTTPYQVPGNPPMHHVWPAGYHEFSLNSARPSLPPVPPVPLIKEQAQRSLIMLEHFQNLEVTTKSRGSKAVKESTLEPTPLASSLLPGSYPSFAPDETRYLTARTRKLKNAENVLPAAPTKTPCALTSWPAKYRDPKTGLPYYDLLQYKMIQRLLAGGCAWSGLLGAWVGPRYGDMGRAARGVPEGFGMPVVAKDDEVKEEVAG